MFPYESRMRNKLGAFAHSINISLWKTGYMRINTRLAVLTAAILLAAGPVLCATSLAPAGARWTVPAESASPGVRALALLGYGLAAFGAIRIADTAKLAAKYVTRAGAAVGDYKAGVEQAGGDWESGAKAGEPNYEAGVQESIAKKRYGRGIAAAGAGKYVRNASTLGSQRYQPGVANAQAAWATGVQPSLDRLKSLQLPPRGQRRSPQNQARANMVALELGKLKDAS